MSQSKVYVPSEGPLLVRHPLVGGASMPTDMYRKDQSRPSTQGGTRFGQKSRNMFFTRHNPQPNRVHHIKGLNDVPICTVNDDGMFAGTQYTLTFPPNGFSEQRLKDWKGLLPVNGINANSQFYPVNTITGLNFFTGKNSLPYRERAVPSIGLVPVSETWRDELRYITEKAGLLPPQQDPMKALLNPEIPTQIQEQQRPRTQYSADTGRLIPPPSRAMSRHPSRHGSRSRGGMDPFQQLMAQPDTEAMVMQMLCQILQTEDVTAVKSWLCNAPETEKSMVMEMIRTAMQGKDDYYQHDPAMGMRPATTAALMPGIAEDPVDLGEGVGGTDSRIDRLNLDAPAKELPEWLRPTPAAVAPVMAQNLTTDTPDIMDTNPPVSDVFQSKPNVDWLTPDTATNPVPVAMCQTESRLRYTKTAADLPNPAETEGQWVPGASFHE